MRAALSKVLLLSEILRPMSTIFLTLFTFVLILVSLFLVLVILMQRANTNAGLGAAFGGGIAESTFGADTGNILTKATVWATVAFFVLSMGLYLGYMGREGGQAVPHELTPILGTLIQPVDGMPAPEGIPAVVAGDDSVDGPVQEGTVPGALEAGSFEVSSEAATGWQPAAELEESVLPETPAADEPPAVSAGDSDAPAGEVP